MSRRADRLESGEISLLSAMLASQPKLTGARCTDHAELFDPQAPGEDRATCRRRHEQAAALCATCPAVGLCRTWALTQPRDLTRHVIGGIRPRLNGQHDDPNLPRRIGA